MPNIFLTPDPLAQLRQAQQETAEYNHGFAHVMYAKLMQEIAYFEGTLGPEEESGGYLASFGREILIHIERVGFSKPYLIILEGKILQSGQRVRLVQHVSQLNVLFSAVPKSPDRSQPRRIGFSPESA